MLTKYIWTQSPIIWKSRQCPVAEVQGLSQKKQNWANFCFWNILSHLRLWKQSYNNCFVVKTSLCSFKWLSFHVFLIIILSICSCHSFHSLIHYSSSYERIVLWQQYANEIFESNLAWLMYWIKGVCKWDRKEITNLQSQRSIGWHFLNIESQHH